MQKKEDCFYFGKVIKTHGIKGEISIRIDADSPQNYRHLSHFFLEIRNGLVPFFISKMSIHTDKAYVKLQDIDTVEAAAGLAGLDIYLPLELLPKLTGNKFYFHEVAGFKVVDAVNGELGSIEKVLEYPGQALFQIFSNGREVLIPIRDELIQKVDRRSKTIFITAPEGLIDLYLNS
ncbi:MAG: 16S rRNA processing protein RimM [Bacteroidales bacterium]|nr:16S rRNA processing protein RimM [Bacteroidales bacterium]